MSEPIALTDVPDDGPPALTHVRPTTALEMLDRVYAVLRQRPVFFVVTALLYAMPKMAEQAFLPFSQVNPREPATVMPLLPWILLRFAAEQLPLAAFLFGAFHASIFPGRPISLGGLVKDTIERFPYLLLTRAVAWAGILIVATPGVLALMGAAQSGGSILLTMGGAAILSMALWLAMMWALVPAVVVVERLSFFQALARSFDLMRWRASDSWRTDGAMRRLVLIALVPGAVMVAAEWAAVAAGVVESMPIEGDETARRMVVVSPVLYVLLSGTAKFVIGALFTAGLMLLYIEGRIRTELFDVQVRLIAREPAREPEPEEDDDDEN